MKKEMKQEGKSAVSPVVPVLRTKEEAKRLYDRISRFYDFFTAAFERKYAEMALERLSVKEGEAVLEIGFGSGHCFRQIAQSVGENGKAYGIDISTGMLEVTRRKLERAQLMDRAELHCGDAASLPYDDNTFDGVFMSFTLELFDTSEIPKVLAEIERVLKPGGRAIIGLYHKNSWHYWVNLIFMEGLVRRKLFKMSIDELLSANVEFSRSGAKPLVRVYSQRDCKYLFNDFSDVKIEKYHWKNDQIPKIGRFLPDFLPSFLGWYIFIFARKQ